MVNKVILIGRLGRDPEFRATTGGVPVAKASLATSEKRTSPSGEKQEFTEWHRIVFWNKQAEVARDYLAKGSLVYIEGKLHYSSFDGKDGNKVYTTDINVTVLQMLSFKDEGSGAGSGGGGGGGGRSNTPRAETPEPKPKYDDGGFEDDDLPF